MNKENIKKESIFLTNSLSRKKEEFTPIESDQVRMYTCGPTIYDYPTIGNWRTYTLSDLVSRVLKFNGYKVLHVMNMTDVGHLSGDNLGDASVGEDRMAKAAEKEGVDAWAVADKYGSDFVDSMSKLNILKPDKIVRATAHIPEQISLIQKLEQKGLTYKTSDGIYFDIGKYESTGNKYGELSNIDELHTDGERIDPNPEKKDPRDFALWKFFATGQKRHNMEWESPWGVGYPGWHIECSAMSMKYLGDTFDIHLGGEDLKSTHHPNEIAQSEASTGCKPFVKYWIHGAFLKVNGGRMGKSLGNAYTIHDIIQNGYDPLALRYFYLTGHYHKQINFTWESLDSSQISLNRLRKEAPKQSEHTFDQDERSIISDNKYFANFLKAINDDLNLPLALGILWELMRDQQIENTTKALLISEFDQVLGLDIYAQNWQEQDEFISNDQLPEEVKQMLSDREKYRTQKDFVKADEIRDAIEKLGYTLEDTPDGVKLKK